MRHSSSPPHSVRFPRLLLLSLLVLASALPVIVPAQEWRGFSVPTFATGDGPQSLATGDFNGDGIIDLATANSISDTVSVFLGNGSAGGGDGTFAPQATYAAGDEPLSVTTGDFNGDGITDLAIANRTSNDVSVLLGNEDAGNPGFGDGTFAIQVTYAAGDRPLSVTTGDFNGDGITDLATANFTSDNISVLLGNEDAGNPGFGDGTFAAQVTYAAGDGSGSVTTGDFNGDGITDLAAANRISNNVSVLLGNGSLGLGDGTFAAHVTYAAGTTPFTMTTGDFNGDGITDLAASNRSSNNVSVLLGNGSAGIGNGTFAAQITYGAGAGPSNLTTGDFNSDGITDLATANSNSDNISVLLGNEDAGNPGFGDGTFAAQATYAAGEFTLSVTTGDFNGDGITDLATANFNSDNVLVLLGNGSSGVGDGTFASQATYTVGDRPLSVTTGDFNGDGITDLATANIDSNNISVLLGNEDAGNPGLGDGTFASHATYAAGSGSRSVTTGDFNGDGITDLATANVVSNNVSVLLGNEDPGNPGFGDGTFASQATYAAGGGSRSVTTGDFNGDGITDLATANVSSNNVSVLLGNGSSGVGNGTFAAQVTYAAGTLPESVTTGDFNGDGITDLAIANRNSNNVSVLLGNEDAGNPGFGDGTFAVQVTYAASTRPESVTTGDFNGDGILDLATATNGLDSVSVLLGNGSAGVGDGTFAAPATYAAGVGPSSVTTGDFNGDGITDLGATNGNSDDVSVLLNLGFTEPDPVLTPDALAFGAVELGAPAATLSITIDVTGDEDLISTPTLTNDGTGSYALAGVPASSLAQGTSGTLEVTFAPAGLGTFIGEITLATNDFSSPTITIALSGTGVDTIAPTSTATGPTATLTQADPVFAVTYVASDNSGGSGVASVELFYQRDGGGFVSFGSFTSSPISFDTTGTGGDGTYEFYTLATDAAGNTETKTPAAEAVVVFNDTTALGDWLLLNTY